MPSFETKEEFIEYLENTVIPDLKDESFKYTAKDFEEAVYWLRKSDEPKEGQNT